MDELINILVFIGTIAVFIFSAIRKTKKAPNTGKENSQVNLESLFGFQTEPVAETRNEMADITIANNTIVNEKEPDYEEKIIPKREDPIPDKIKDGEIGGQQHKKERFDLKAAIVYTEILKRKNF